MRYILTLIISILIINFSAYGKNFSVEIKVRPVQESQPYGQRAPKLKTDYSPLVGELFQVDFLVEFVGNNTPDFPDFKPSGLEIVKRQSTRNSIIVKNGIALRKTVFSYQMIAERTGTVSLSSIKIFHEGANHRVGNKSIKVVKSRPKPQLVFVAAEPSKNELYPGEGLDINYYLYIRQHSFSDMAQDEKKTPSFKNILKRVKPMPSVPAKSYDSIAGQPYDKYAIYSIHGFAKKSGEIEIGPIKTEFKYRRGFGSSVRSKVLSSKRVKVPVKDLPIPIPNSYTGLVGEHKFELSVPRKRYIVNDSIEMSLIISGEGSLESVEPPVLITDPSIEKFDAQSEIQLDRGEQSGRIKFDLTYIARSPLTLPARSIKLTTLNPTSGEYEEHVLEMPEIVVGGKAATPQPSNPTSNSSQTEGKSQPEVTKAVSNKVLMDRMLAPDFSQKDERKNWFLIINSALALLALIVWLSIWIRRPKVYSVDPKIQKLVDGMKKNGVTYSRLHHLLLYLNDNKPLVDITLGQLIADSSLSDDGKEYFSNIIAMTEKQNYGDVLDIDIDYNPKYFKEVVELLKK